MLVARVRQVLPSDVEFLLEKQRLGQAFVKPGEEDDEEFTPSRDRCRAITFRVPHNAAVQVCMPCMVFTARFCFDLF